MWAWNTCSWSITGDQCVLLYLSNRWHNLRYYEKRIGKTKHWQIYEVRSQSKHIWVRYLSKGKHQITVDLVENIISHICNKFDNMKWSRSRFWTEAIVKWQNSITANNNFKGIVHPKILFKKYSPSGHARCRQICFFTTQDVNWWTEEVSITCVIFISWTLILTAPIHCRGSIGEQVM